MYKNYILAENRSNYKRLPGDKEKNSENNCRFCEMMKNDEGVVLKIKDMFVTVNQYPYNVGHVMIAPIRHVKDPRELNDEELMNMFILINKMMTVIEKTYSIHGFNIGMNLGSVAGSTYEHLHIQLVPRWMGDIGFMESTAKTKIIKESLEDTVRKLKDTIVKEKY